MPTTQHLFWRAFFAGKKKSEKYPQKGFSVFVKKVKLKVEAKGGARKGQLKSLHDLDLEQILETDLEDPPYAI